MSVFKHKVSMERFHQARQKLGGSLIIDEWTEKMLSLREPHGESVCIDLEQIGPLIEALQAFKAAAEYDQLAEKYLAKRAQWRNKKPQ